MLDFHEFQRGEYTIEDAARPGRLRTAVNEETIDAVRAIIENDPHSAYEQIEYILSIGSPAVNSIIHDYLKLRKVCARWAPHQITEGQKQLRVEFCQQSLKRFEEGRSRRVFDIITGDEPWFYHYDSTTKEQSKVWVSKTDPRSTKVHRVKSSGKQMVTIFFIKSGLIKYIPLEPGDIINATWYVNICVPQVFKAVSEWREKTGLRDLIFHDDNARYKIISKSTIFSRSKSVRPLPVSKTQKPTTWNSIQRRQHDAECIRTSYW
ncbi:unnamed protein product [Rotaria sp. Silwood2]|nr:unnamed protein product [Rotaria sp. Silwood2]